MTALGIGSPIAIGGIFGTSTILISFGTFITGVAIVGGVVFTIVAVAIGLIPVYINSATTSTFYY